MPRLACSAVLLSSLWTGLHLHAQNLNPFKEAEKEREVARKRAEMARERGRDQPGAPANTAAPEHGFDKASNTRESARQRAFDRGQKTALPAQEERESLGHLPGVPSNAIRDEKGGVVQQGAPSAAVYNRVMETRRFFRHYLDTSLWNANDSFTDKADDRKSHDAEALRIYPELRRPQSGFSLRQAAINRWIDARQPPLARDSRRTLLVAHMVSLELYGQLRKDRFGIGQIPWEHYIGQRPPAFIERNNFMVEVQGDVVLLPDGLRGKVIRGRDDQPDVLQWLDAEGAHAVSVPQEASGKVQLFKDYDCDYRRIELPKGNYKIIFSKPE